MLRGRAIAGASENRERISHDYYATDPRAVISLLKVERLEFPLLESACGEGHICETVRYYYPNGEIVCSDLVDRGYGVGGIDFLKAYHDTHFKTMLTNPPFRYALEFIKHGLEVADKVIIFAKIQLLEGIQRYEELYSKGKLDKVYVFVNRQNVWRNGSPVNENGKRWQTTMTHGWFVFSNRNTETPTLHWLRNDNLSPEDEGAYRNILCNLGKRGD